MKKPVMLISFRRLREKKGIEYSRRQIDRLEAANKFPKRVPVGDNTVAWIEDEVDKFIADRIAARNETVGALGSERH